MGTLTIRNLDDGLKAEIRMRAARNGRSMEEEARRLLQAAVQSPASKGRPGLATAIRRRFAPFGDFKLALPPRDPVRPPPKFE